MVTKKRTSKQGAAPERRRIAGKKRAKGTGAGAPSSNAKTIVYVHGIGNKPPASVLKAQWDMALFEFDLGERSRMAYWVDRERYPEPDGATATASDYSDGVTTAPRGEVSARALQARWDPLVEQRALEEEIDDVIGSQGSARTRNARRKSLRALARVLLESGNFAVDDRFAKQSRRLEGPEGDALRRIQAQRYGAASVEAKLLDFLPRHMRQWITRTITKTLLRDVNDLFDVEEKSQRMRESLRERLRAGGGPFVVIAHSQGSMIAYCVLSEPEFKDIDVPLFVTIGSPLGITEVQDNIEKLTGRALAVPPSVRRWTNIADPLDPVALDKRLHGEYEPNARGGDVDDKPSLNADSPRHPHSGTGYLSLQLVREPVRTVVDTGLFQPVARFKIARDVQRGYEDMRAAQRQSVLLQIADFGGSETIRQRSLDTLLEAIRKVTGRSLDADELRLDVLDRYVSVSLTRQEAETLASQAMGDAKAVLGRVWKNATKWALVDHSIHTAQVFPAHRSYEARGKDVTWAVLDSGIHGTHPHFTAGKTIVQAFDCTHKRRRDGPLVALDPADPLVQDRYGHGAHVAGIIAGRHVFDARTPKEVVMSGMAPQARLVIYKVLDDNGSGDDAWIIKAIDHVRRTNEEAGGLRIHGVNLSLGGEFDVSSFNCGYTPLCEELRRLWKQGVVVVIASGNEGYAVLKMSDGDEVQANMPMSVGDPGNLDEAIVVGSTHRDSPHTYGTSYFSSRGPTADGRMKPDCVAPGERIWSVRNDAPKKPSRTATRADLYAEMSGTSMAAPHVSGLIAAFLSAKREFIGRPDDVKRILLANCTDLGRQRTMQGEGLPNLVKMLMNV